MKERILNRLRLAFTQARRNALNLDTYIGTVGVSLIGLLFWRLGLALNTHWSQQAGQARYAEFDLIKLQAVGKFFAAVMLLNILRVFLVRRGLLGQRKP